MNLTQTNETWCIEDTLFYPLGLINHTTGNKTVFVTWNENYLMNFIFKKSPDNTNRCNKFMIEISEEIIDIKILEVNTIVLLANGEVCYFSSIKSIHRISWLKSGVRCVSGSLAGFSLIRIFENNRISLELYQDIPNVGKTPQESVRSFDLTFDEMNLFDSDWSDDKFTLTSIAICESNRKFIELLVKEVDLQIDEIHIFSMGNQLFALLPKNEEDYEIKTLAPQISPIELVKFLEESNMLLIFLNCGIIEVWYLSRIAWILEKYTYINGSEFVHYTFAGDDVLFFTDEQRVSRLVFSYDSVQHTCQVLEQSINAPGMVAVTYVEEGSSLVCLSNNNIFYHLTFDDEQDANEDHEDPAIFELTNEKVQEMMSKTNQLQDITTLPMKIEKLIEEEYKMQELIAVCRKSSIYSDLISASISFSQHIPETQETLIYPGDNGLPPFSYFAVVSIKIISNEIFKSTIWSLMISYLNNNRLLRITPDLLQQKFSILIPILRNRDELIPEFEIHLLTHVNIGQDFVCINIPVKIQDFDVKKLFSRNQGLRQRSKTSNTTIPFTFKITSPQIHVKHVYEIFGLFEPKTSENLEDEILVENLYFLGEKVGIYFCEPTNTINVESQDPVAIYYAKVCLTKYLWENFEKTTDDLDELRKSLLEIQCQIEKKYGSLTEGEMHMENLKRIYEKFRKDIVWKF
ncbi:uncharacterized protein LOC129915213 [Episyrphus balteatus]|uniref:uncharacterized protein LOC129915213 n=1 Tax=Episyrphus balteatus TaxID=286459 RepID=UPI0024864F5A|nr:uncharacterized protein LOC129915213 [Episyrphus balteatus]